MSFRLIFRLNATSMQAFVVIQESLSILTHSTRRFLVVCSFKPSTFTVKAGYVSCDTAIFRLLYIRYIMPLIMGLWCEA